MLIVAVVVIIIIIVVIVLSMKKNSSPAAKYSSVGCYRDQANRALAPNEGDPLLDGTYQTRQNPIEKCYNVAKAKNHRYFAIQDGGWCASGNGEDYKKYGPATNCTGGEGGTYANDVYVINN